jgi:hypothetical protein
LLKKETLHATSTTSYSSSIDALNDLRNSGQITEINSSLSHLANGVSYSFVEVTCKDGTQCGLQAYGNEALELHRAAFQELLKITLNKK